MNACGYLPIIKNGAARFKPIKSMPKYIAKPNAANVAIVADKLPKNPIHGFDRTTSRIIQVIVLQINYFQNFVIFQIEARTLT